MDLLLLVAVVGELCIGIQDHLDHHSMARPFLLVIIRECTTRVTGPLFMANLYLVHHLQFPHLCLQCIQVAVFLGEIFFQYQSCYNAGRAGLRDVKLSNRPVIGVVYMQVAFILVIGQEAQQELSYFENDAHTTCEILFTWLGQYSQFVPCTIVGLLLRNMGYIVLNRLSLFCVLKHAISCMNHVDMWFHSRDLAGAALPGSPGQAERPPSTTEEHIVQGKPKRKKLSKHQAKVEGRRGWTTAEVEALISLRGQMDEEFDRNKQKQGTLFFSALRY